MGVNTATLDYSGARLFVFLKMAQSMREKRERLELSLRLKKITGFPIGFMTGATIWSAIIVIAINQS